MKKKKRRRKVPKRYPFNVKAILAQWFYQHVEYPFPTSNDLEYLKLRTCLSNEQIQNFFSNKRTRCKNKIVRWWGISSKPLILPDKITPQMTFIRE
jgi:hypothetical protein